MLTEVIVAIRHGESPSFRRFGCLTIMGSKRIWVTLSLLVLITVFVVLSINDHSRPIALPQQQSPAFDSALPLIKGILLFTALTVGYFFFDRWRRAK